MWTYERITILSLEGEGSWDRRALYGVPAEGGVGDDTPRNTE